MEHNATMIQRVLFSIDAFIASIPQLQKPAGVRDKVWRTGGFVLEGFVRTVGASQTGVTDAVPAVVIAFGRDIFVAVLVGLEKRQVRMMSQQVEKK
ncbi:hypothetical protein [Rhizobium sp. RAF56]|uniref:hypothetical protein n=1 Tax=Rhizobium sp. RAF56 TaxID=3233062 RepID=UPI003F9A7B6E